MLFKVKDKSLPHLRQIFRLLRRHRFYSEYVWHIGPETTAVHMELSSPTLKHIAESSQQNSYLFCGSNRLCPIVVHWIYSHFHWHEITKIAGDFIDSARTMLLRAIGIVDSLFLCSIDSKARTYPDKQLCSYSGIKNNSHKSFFQNSFLWHFESQYYGPW